MGIQECWRMIVSGGPGQYRVFWLAQASVNHRAVFWLGCIEEQFEAVMGST